LAAIGGRLAEVPRRTAELAFYVEPGPLTALDGVLGLECLEQTGDVAGIARLVQGLVLHEAYASVYGVSVPPDRRAEMHLRSAKRLLARIRELDPAPLEQPRPPERRLVGYCRHFSVLTTALLRHVGVPARARAGFGAYFGAPGQAIDHWIVEHWDAGRGRWQRSDVQYDDVLRGCRALGFDPLDVPPVQFLAGGEAWQACRAGHADPALFGIAEWWGAWFVRNNVVRDLAALNKVEALPWDSWGLMDRCSPLGKGPADELVDRVADATTWGDWSSCRQLYADNASLRPPDAFTW
jgi:Transglutaminase-like superfamily